MYRILLLTFAFLSLAQSQDVARFVRDRHDQFTEIFQERQSQLKYNQTFSLVEFLDIIAESRENSLSPYCKEDMYALVSARLGKFEYPEFQKDVWLPVRDSAGQMSTAILKGHIYYAGHYSECVTINAQLTGRERPFTADYFKVDLDIMFRSNAENGTCPAIQGNVVGWSFGLCLPASCSSAELQRFMLSDTAIPNPVCRIQRTNDPIEEVNAGYYIVLSVMGVIITLCVLSGIADFFFSDYLSRRPISRNLIWRLFMSLSIYTNISGIFDISGSKKEGQIAPIHCIRFFSMCWVVLGHLTQNIAGVVANPLDIFPMKDDLTTEFILNAYFAVDSFFFIGGVLLTYLWFKSFKRNPKLTNSPAAWVMVYVHRILRISPPFYIMLLFFAFVMKQLLFVGSPVNMNSIMLFFNCKGSWWVEFTYLQDIIGDGSKAIAASLLIISTAVNMFLVFYNHWPATMPFLGPKDPLETNADKYTIWMYDSPVTRCQVYIIGMLVGWFLQSNKRVRINPLLNIVLWLLSIALMLTVVLGLHSQTTGKLLPVFWRAMYSAFSKPVWALGLSWILISCYYGYGGPINAFMSWHIWVPLGRLSYCGYLLHYPMIYLVLLQNHDEMYFSSFIQYIITCYLPVVALTFFFSIFWSAFFEISFSRMEILLLGGNRTRGRPEEEASVIDKLKEKLKKADEAMSVALRL